MAHAQSSNTAVCRCGETRIELAGEPIDSVICFCQSCRKAARQFEQSPGAPRVLNAHGGVDYCLYRKDRVDIVHGAHHLHEHRLRRESPTRRVVAQCCGAPMFVDFTPGHWLSIFRDRLSGPAPQPRMCAMTKDKPLGVELPDGMPAYDTVPPGLMVRLLAAWVAMGFRRPRITW